jgi:uncharacterized heparinase superfamily protein
LLSLLAFRLHSAALVLLGALASSPLLRWAWRSLAAEKFFARLRELRPADPHSVTEILAGKYLLASRVVETGGVSPFSVDAPDPAWRDELHSFAWLRHFADQPAGSERQFARTLVLDWIGRHGGYDKELWANPLMARRLINWLTHYELIALVAPERQRRIIDRAIADQAHALARMGRFDPDPVGALFAAIGALAFALCEEEGRGDVARRASRLVALLKSQLDADGLHRSRSPQTQFEILDYLVPVRLALGKADADRARPLGVEVERMHAALAAMTLTTGEPAFFNGTGQLPLEMLLAVQANGGQRAEFDIARVQSGYGLVQLGRGKIIADTGLVPAPGFTRRLHAAPLAFEFSFGNTLIVGNCGPAPVQLKRGGEAFRRPAAHSTLDLDNFAPLVFGLGADAPARPRHPADAVKVDMENSTIELSTRAYERKFGIRHQRALTLIEGGETLIGQDTLTATRRLRPLNFALRFHLAPGATASSEAGQSLMRLALRGGEQWVFLWEGAEAAVEPSVRQSLHYGLVDTIQIVLTGTASGRNEIAWSFARQPG